MVTLTARLVWRIRSTSEMVDTSDVSLSSDSQLFDRPGRAMRVSCGSTTLKKPVRLLRPSAEHASSWPLGKVLNAASQISLENAANTRLNAIIAARKVLIWNSPW
ncbi:hypothetical protein D3C79_754470 [compost metagenome]